VNANFLAHALTVFLAPSALLAQDPTASRVTLDTETVTFGAPVGLFDADNNRVSMAFFARPPGTDAEASARRALAWSPDSGGAAVVIDLTFTPDSTNGMVQQLKACRVRFRGFQHGPMDIEGGARECHIVSTGGMLRPGGAMMGLMEGQGAGYSFRLPFSVVFPASPDEDASAPAASSAPAAPTIPPDTVSGSASYDGQKLGFTHGLAWWDAENTQVNLAFFDHAPPAGILADLRSGSWGEGGPRLSLDLRFEGPPRGEPSAITYCFVNIDWPRGGPMGNNTDGKGCGVAEVGGDLRAGGTVAAKVKGQATGPGDKPYSWDLIFNLPIEK
jgi:hypothetical protein